MKIYIIDKIEKTIKSQNNYNTSKNVSFDARTVEEQKSIFDGLLSYIDKCDFAIQSLDPTKPRGKVVYGRTPLHKYESHKLKRINKKTLLQYKGDRANRLIVCGEGCPYRKIKSKKVFSRYCLGVIDIDCSRDHKDGIRCLNWLKSFFGKNLYADTSIRGFGFNAYFLYDRSRLDKTTQNSWNICDDFDKLEKWLKQEVAKQGFDIGQIEVKGHPVVRKWDQEIKLGKLVSLPPNVLDHFFRFERTSIISTELVKSLELDPARITRKEVDAKIKELGKISVEKSFTFAHSKLMEWFRNPEVSKLIKKVAKTAHNSPANEQAAYELRTFHRNIKEDHYRAILSISLYLKENPLRVDATPTAAYAYLWRKLYEEKVVSVSFDTSVFARIRQVCLALGLLEWQKRDFVRPVFTIKIDGEIVKYNGSACKFSASKDLYDYVRVYKYSLSIRERNTFSPKPYCLHDFAINFENVDRRLAELGLAG
jgi:hypothetical protein